MRTSSRLSAFVTGEERALPLLTLDGHAEAQKKWKENEMKKLLVLILVLGMNSAASATLTLVPSMLDLTVNIGGPGGLNDGILEGDMYLVISSNGELTNYALTAAAPDLSGKFGYTEDFGGLGCPVGFTGEVWVLASSVNGYPISEPVMTVVAESFRDCVAIGWFDESMNSGIIEILCIPEPTTLALLGLGGLMLWWRRK